MFCFFFLPVNVMHFYRIQFWIIFKNCGDTLHEEQMIHFKLLLRVVNEPTVVSNPKMNKSTAGLNPSCGHCAYGVSFNCELSPVDKLGSRARLPPNSEHIHIKCYAVDKPFLTQCCCLWTEHIKGTFLDPAVDELSSRGLK